MRQPGKILVTGATGTVGGQVAKQLAGAGADVRAMTRNPGAAGFPDGVDVVRGDLSDPASLHQPLRDVDVVFLMWPFISSAGVDDVLAVIRQHAPGRLPFG